MSIENLKPSDDAAIRALVQQNDNLKNDPFVLKALDTHIDPLTEKPIDDIGDWIAGYEKNKLEEVPTTSDAERRAAMVEHSKTWSNEEK